MSPVVRVRGGKRRSYFILHKTEVCCVKENKGLLQFIISAQGGSVVTDIGIRYRWWWWSSSSGQLVVKGREELRQLAARLSLLLPGLLSEENKERISLRSSSKHRCVSSVEAFQEGLWGQSGQISSTCGWDSASPHLYPACFVLCLFRCGVPPPGGRWASAILWAMP